jgi:hypothetical protein
MYRPAAWNGLPRCVVFPIGGDEGLRDGGRYYNKLKKTRPRSSTNMNETDKTPVMIVLLFMARPLTQVGRQSAHLVQESSDRAGSRI